MAGKNKAAFFDRDGVINDDTGHYYVFRPDDFVLCPGVIEGLKKVHRLGYLIIIISNQGGIARGQFTTADTDAVHRKFTDIMAANGVPISEIYYCPHHPEAGNCLCRKPQPLMIEKALARFDIDPAKSFMLGDRDNDVLTAENAGVRGFKMDKNSNLLTAVDNCLKAMGDI
ncbi:MAG: HAD family hydrolase [Salinivirgaceae bacterium]|nr:HAD family hydrolase [Salinivirgaceae bacterium]